MVVVAGLHVVAVRPVAPPLVAFVAVAAAAVAARVLLLLQTLLLVDLFAEVPVRSLLECNSARQAPWLVKVVLRKCFPPLVTSGITT